ncbi:MAG TPA: hypothetical protein VF177_22665 [Anaerolineae bacterium]
MLSLSKCALRQDNGRHISPVGDNNEHVIVVQVPTAGVPTLYPIIGDLFG